MQILQKIKIYLQERKQKRLEKEHYFRQLAVYLDSIGRPSWVTGRRYERLSLQVANGRRTLIQLKEKV